MNVQCHITIFDTLSDLLKLNEYKKMFLSTVAFKVRKLLYYTIISLQFYEYNDDSLALLVLINL